MGSVDDGGSIFVFGSNTAGRHGRGAALYARKHHNAIYGVGEGIQGQSYGIPTKDGDLVSLSLEEIAQGVERFKSFARRNPQYTFQVTPVGCGLAGYSRGDVRPLFEGSPDNVTYTKEWDE